MLGNSSCVLLFFYTIPVMMWSLEYQSQCFCYPYTWYLCTLLFARYIFKELKLIIIWLLFCRKHYRSFDFAFENIEMNDVNLLELLSKISNIWCFTNNGKVIEEKKKDSFRRCESLSDLLKNFFLNNYIIDYAHYKEARYRYYRTILSNH